MDRAPRRGSGLAAVAVAFLAVLGWWWFGGNGPMTPTTNSERLAPRAEDTRLASASPPGPQRPRPGTLRLTAFEVAAPTRLVVHYATDGGCAANPGRADVRETDAAVTVTLHVDPSARPSSRCPDAAAARPVPVLLDVPLGDRSLLDGSLPRAQRVPPLP